MQKPGPANYDTRSNKIVTLGGTGSTVNQKWSFGTEKRGINSDIIKRAEKVPACTDYSPSRKQSKIKITFG